MNVGNSKGLGYKDEVGNDVWFGLDEGRYVAGRYGNKCFVIHDPLTKTIKVRSETNDVLYIHSVPFDTSVETRIGSLSAGDVATYVSSVGTDVSKVCLGNGETPKPKPKPDGTSCPNGQTWNDATQSCVPFVKPTGQSFWQRNKKGILIVGLILGALAVGFAMIPSSTKTKALGKFGMRKKNNSTKTLARKRRV